MDAEPEKFEVTIRIMGNEILAFSLMSDSPRKNWILVSLISLIIVIMLLQYALPGLISLMSMFSA